MVFILADDLGWADLGCYGNTFYETPNLDRLARTGMRFTDAYAASPVCSPTRASIMTGKYPARLHLTEWIPGKRPTRREKILGPNSHRQLALGVVTIAEHLRTGGYVTGHIGKWHLGGTNHLPEHQGFDTNVGGTHAGSPSGGYFLPNRMNLSQMTKGTYLTDRLTSEAIRFIETNRDHPFFLYQSYHSVHTPIQAKPEYVSKYNAKAAGAGIQVNATYAGMVQSLDDGVGRILDTLERLALTRNTVVFFMSGNGGLSRVTSNAPLRAGKGHIYEGGIREPLLVRAPGVTKPGSVCNVPVSSVDFYPTIAELATAQSPVLQGPDGISLVPLLRGETSPSHRPLFFHYPHYSPQGGKPAGAVRSGPWKLVELFAENRVELYNLENDIGEANNLAGTHPEQVDRLRAELVRWRTSVDALMPTSNPGYTPGQPPDGRPKTTTQPLLIPGKLDPAFTLLNGVAVDECDLGYSVRGNQAGGVALQALPTARTGHLRFMLKLQSQQQDKSTGAWRNGFFVFGDGTKQADLIYCGLYLGGRRMLSIFEGKAPGNRTEKALAAPPYTRFELTIDADLEAGTITMGTADQTVRHRLSEPLDAIRYVGYSVINTTTAFSPVTTSRVQERGTPHDR
ncbi:MAG: sulfatase [Lentisphaerae bacterium]|nr:sulfatase [Lentisphaerota bacterium]MBT4817627.1 sulfatase [Lentisphaerota bacterium]MBT5605371.1 sulfatase [Lentisphaerota bacterium]MBT7060376.1 sulfatase [Lentisphaerota bacterium]MBT7844770.1 sulfatase [Lentisphaerota bacterium]